MKIGLGSTSSCVLNAKRRPRTKKQVKGWTGWDLMVRPEPVRAGRGRVGHQHCDVVLRHDSLRVRELSKEIGNEEGSGRGGSEQRRRSRPNLYAKVVHCSAKGLGDQARETERHLPAKNNSRIPRSFV